MNSDAFTKANLKKAGYAENPLDDPELPERYQVHAVPINTFTLAALEDVELEKRSKQRSKNLFALGLLYWLYDRPIEPTARGGFGVKFAQARRSSRRPTGARSRPATASERPIPSPRPTAFRGIADRAGRVPHHQRQRGLRPGQRHRRAAGRQVARVLQLPDHAGHRRAARARPG